MANKEKYVKMIQKKRWRRLLRTADSGNKDEQLVMLDAMGEAGMSNDEVVNLLINYLSSEDRDLKLHAVKALTQLGDGAAQSEVHLQHLLDKIDDDDTELNEAIREAIVAVRESAATDIAREALSNG